jgi:hypothetical protein
MLHLVVWNKNILCTRNSLIYKSMLKIILTFRAETWSIKWKHRHKLLVLEMDYLSIEQGYYEWMELEMKQLEQKWELRKTYYRK